MQHAVVDFYNQINLLYGAITEFCSPQTCPEMKATDECVITQTLPTPRNRVTNQSLGSSTYGTTHQTIRNRHVSPHQNTSRTS